MTKHTSVVQLNGHQYDAVSGQIIGAAKGAATSLRSVPGSIDGFVRSKNVKRVVPTRSTVRAAAHRAQRHTQRSKTLMRSSVNRPRPPIKNSIGESTKPTSHAYTDPKRAFRAKTLARNDKVTRFSHPTQKSHAAKPLSGEVLPLPLSKLMKEPHQTSKSVAAPVPSMITSVSHQKLESLLDQALAQAQSHKKQEHHRRGRISKFLHSRKHLAAVAVISIVVLAFAAWIKLPQLSVKLAATKSHVNASLPTYVPPGFAMSGHAKATEDKVVVSFKSKEDPAKSFSLTQRNSNMDSTAMASTLLPTKAAVQTSQINGTTVYIYDANNDAMWVNHGVHYQLHDKANLDSNEVLKIAQSL